MVCYHPLLAYKITDKQGNVKMKIIGNCYDHESFNEKLGNAPMFEARLKPRGGSLELMKLPCGQCIGCRLERSRMWAVRCIHEAQLHEENCFLTLTYDDAHLPDDHSLHKDHLQKFFKRLRKALPNIKIRYFACGEYGSNLKTSRPHYHAIIFGWFPSDKKLFSIRGSSKIFVSPLLSKVWPFGFHTVGSVTFESAAYVARYVLKKHTGKDADLVYDGLCPEFVVMSRKPGIAREWIEKYKDDVYPNDYIVIRDNIVCKPPKYYDRIYDEYLNGDLEYIKNKRIDLHKDVEWSDLIRSEKHFSIKIKKREGKFYRRIEDV